MSMSSVERIKRAHNLKEADRVPVAPLNIYIHGYLSGLTLKEFMTEPKKAVEATEKVMKEKLGVGDEVYPNILLMDHFAFPLKSGWDRFTLPWKIFDEFPPEGNIPSVQEKKMIDDYEKIMKDGFAELLFSKKVHEQTFQLSIDEIIYNAFEYPKEHAKEWRKFYERNSIPFVVGGRACIPLDLLQYYRGYAQLVRDIHEQPEKVKEMCNWLVEYEVLAALRQAELMGAGEIPGAETILWVNGGPPGMPPEVFEDFFWPTAKKGIDMITERGFKVRCHWDNDLTPHLHRMVDISKGCPKGSVILSLEKTDMKKAKEILGDKVCLYGNVSSNMLVNGTPEDVKDYSKKLIDDCAEGGGFILGTECETPWNAKPENVRAMIETAEEYGKY